MKRKVCMYVWNHFTNDARVMRECTTLSNQGYTVDLICIDDPSDTELQRHEVINDNFHVYRVARYPRTLMLLQSILQTTKKHKWLLLIYAAIWFLLLYIVWIPTVIITLLLGFIYIPKVRKVFIKGNIIIRMTARGYFGKYDIYHSNDLNTMPQGYIAAKWRFKKRKLVYDSHEVQTSRTGYNSPIYGKMEKFFLKRIDSMIVENHTRAKYNEELYGLYPNVIHNYPFKQLSQITEKVDLHQQLNIQHDEKILLYQGGIQIGRGLEKLIEAVPLFNEGVLVFIGDGKQKEELVSMVKERKLEARVKFIPKVPLSDLPKYTNNAYLGFQVLNNICFNHWSASSNKLFEYMMAGVPVVACRFPEIEKIVTENEVGICVDSHDPADIARGVNYLLANEEKRDIYSRNCIYAKDKYNWENEEKNLIEIYKALENVGGKEMKLCTVGLGYIGLPTSIMFAKYDVDVVGVDVRADVVDSLNGGKIHLEEPGLQEALTEVLAKNKFKASLVPEKSDAYIIAVPSPNKDDEHKSIDLSYVLSAMESVIPLLEKGNVIIVESTIAPRSMDDVIKPVVEQAGFTVGEDIYLVHCPERVLPGQIMHELVHNNRIIGGMTPACTEAGAKVYGKLVEGELIYTDAKTAEMSKLMENTYRDVNIALANELTKICNDLDINALDVIEMANKHPRVNIHSPGPGVGGHCLAVDPYFIISKSPDLANIIKLSRETNVSMPQYVIENVDALLENVDGKVVTVFGLTYKGDVDDIRESPALEIYDALKAKGTYEVRAFDPHVEAVFVEEDIEKATKDADLIVILSDHSEFKELNYDQLMGMRNKVIFDTKNVVSSHSEQFDYVNFGNLYNYAKKKESMKTG